MRYRSWVCTTVCSAILGNNLWGRSRRRQGDKPQSVHALTREQRMQAARALNHRTDCSRVARTRLALDAGQLLIMDRERQIEMGFGQLAVCDSVRRHVDCEPLDGRDGFFARWAVCPERLASSSTSAIQDPSSRSLSSVDNGISIGDADEKNGHIGSAMKVRRQSLDRQPPSAISTYRETAISGERLSE